MLIKAEDINYTIGGRKILDSVSLSIESGDLVTIIGPNGAGKSTLIKCILGIIKPTSGTIIKKEGIKIGYAPQSFMINRNIPIRVSDFIILNKNTTNERLKEVSQMVSVTSLLDKNLSDLSGGEKQKVLLARSLIEFPDLLILDEITAGIDVSGQLDFYQLIETIWQKYKITVIMISHDLHMVMAKSLQVICLYNHVCCSGKPTQVINNPNFINLFGDKMQDVLAIYNHQHDHIHKTQDNFVHNSHQ